MIHCIALYLLAVSTPSIATAEDPVEQLVEEIFPHHKFECDPEYEVYETEFSFLQGLARGFVHVERHRIFFEYYFPAEHWVGFSTADQSIEGQQDQCSSCYYSHYYPLQPNANRSNLYPQCIAECLQDTIFVATVNSDEQNINNWNIIEFQIIAQESKKFEKKMYRIPPSDEILEIWGSSYSPYRKDAHFETDLYKIGAGETEKEFIHARFWRKYDFAPNSDLDEYDASNAWQAFVSTNDDLYYPDSLCFTSIGSFYGGEYPYDDDAMEGLLPGFYIDTEHLANVHCYALEDIKVDCGQDWSWMTVTKQQFAEQQQQQQQQEEEEAEDGDNGIDTENMEDTDDTDDTDDDDTLERDTDTDTYGEDSDISDDTDTEITPDDLWSGGDDFDSLDTEYDADIALNIETVTTTTTTTTTTTAADISTSSTASAASLQPTHGEDCCSAISGISYDDIHCIDISKSSDYIVHLEEKWKSEQCGRADKLPTDLSEGVAHSVSNDSDCDHLWAYFNQIHEICYQFTFAKNKMKIYNHFKTKGGYECFGRNNDECKAKEAEIEDASEDGNTNTFNNFVYVGDDEGDDDVDSMTVIDTSEAPKKDKESELAEMEEDGGLTVTSLGILGLIIVALTLYVLYWFFCSTSSKGYRQSSQFMTGAYYEDDIDTDDMYYSQRRQMQGYNKYENGDVEDTNNDNENNNSDWSEDEQLGVIDDDCNKMKIKSSKKMKKKRHKKKKKKPPHDRDVEAGYDVSVNDIHSMPIHEDNSNNANDAVEINVKDAEDDEECDYYYDEETLPDGDGHEIQEQQQQQEEQHDDHEEIDFQDQ